VKLVVQNRAILGSAEARRLRRRGLIPGVLYGRDQPIAFTVPERVLRSAVGGHGGSHAVLDVVVETGQAHSSVLKGYQQDPVRGWITHVDLQEVRLDQPIHASVSVTLVGEARGTKEGGILTQVTSSVNVEGLPLEIPERLDFDVSDLGVGDSARLAQLEVPAGVTLLDDLDGTVLATVTLPRAEEPEPVEEAEEEGAEAPAAQEEQAAETETASVEAAGTTEG
jgi:large subunit ribosomal protein L25